MTTLLRRPRSLLRDARLAEVAPRYVAGNGRLSPVDQLEIYREQFWLRHTAALLEDFPGLSGVLGQRDWEKLVEGYLEEASPTSWSLRELGQRMLAYVETATWLPNPELCADMARLEWATIELFDAEDVSPVDAARLVAIPEEAWQTARIVLSPAVALLRVDYPVLELRQNLAEARGAPVPIPERAVSRLVLYRGVDRGLYHVALSRAAFELLEGLRDGLSLVAACERAAERVPSEAPEIESTVGEWFSDWGRRGWVVDVETS
jgi:hypothetical protein